MSNKLTNISSLGKEILQAIENQRLTKKHVYDKMAISRGTLDNWITGATAPSHVELQELYKILNIGSQKSEPGKHEDVKLIPTDVWLELQQNNAIFKVEIDRLWGLVSHLTGNNASPHKA